MDIRAIRLDSDFLEIPGRKYLRAASIKSKKKQRKRFGMAVRKYSLCRFPKSYGRNDVEKLRRRSVAVEVLHRGLDLTDNIG
jgi:hypothetical protein